MHWGLYTCRADNAVGSVQESVSLIVHGEQTCTMPVLCLYCVHWSDHWITINGSITQALISSKNEMAAIKQITTPSLTSGHGQTRQNNTFYL